MKTKYTRMGNRVVTDWVANFWEKVDKNGPVIREELGPCWVWCAAKYRTGYGAYGVRRQGGGYTHHKAHRFAFECANGPIPDGMFACHHCDNRSCVRPDHIFIGTHSDNMGDMAAKGRSTHGDKHWSVRQPEKRPRGARNGSHTKPETVRFGENSVTARLTLEQVAELRAERSSGMAAASLAAKYGIHEAHVRKIVRGSAWPAHAAHKSKATR